MKTFPEMLRGDIIQIDWVDIHEDPTGNPDKADLAKRRSWGQFWGFKKDRGLDCLVTTSTMEMDATGYDQSGFCIYPIDCILDAIILKKVRRKRLLKSPEEGKQPKQEDSTSKNNAS